MAEDGVRVAGQDLKDNRLHAVLCELVPGGVPKEIIAAHAARLLSSIARPMVSRPRLEPPAALIEDLLRIDGQLRETRKNSTLPSRPAGPA